jgi:hypothetical protein
MKKIGFLILALVIALGALGVGYAKWTDSITVNGSVNSGSINLGIFDPGTTDDGIIDLTPPNPPPGFVNLEPDASGSDPQCPNSPGSNPEGKDVASAISTNQDEDFVLNGLQYYKSVHEQISNAYPWYSVTLRFFIANGGTVPIKIDSFNIVVDTGSENLLPWMVFHWTIFDENGAMTNYDGSYEAFLTSLHGLQIRGGGMIRVAPSICFVERSATGAIMPQGKNAGFTVTITGSQWNEVP